MRKSILLFLSIIIIGLFVSCGSTPKATKEVAYAPLYEEEPLTVLVMPPINTSVNVDAKDYFYSTLNKSLADAGYYTYPFFMTLDTLQNESAYDSELFLEADLSKFHELFNADLLLFTVIKNWEKHPVSGYVNIGIEYIIRSAKTNETVYKNGGTVAVSTKVDTGTLWNAIPIVGGLVKLAADAVATAVKTAATDYVFVARQCNAQTIANDIPKSKYHPKYGLDKQEIATGTNLGGVRPATDEAQDGEESTENIEEN